GPPGVVAAIDVPAGGKPPWSPTRRERPITAPAPTAVSAAGGKRGSVRAVGEPAVAILAVSTLGRTWVFKVVPGAPPSSSAIGVLTFTPSVPSGTSSFATLPSSTASTSTVAFSEIG